MLYFIVTCICRLTSWT